MNNWNNMMGMGSRPQTMPNVMNASTGQPQGVKPLLPPQFMLPEMSMNINPAPPVNSPLPLIGPVLPDNMTMEDMALSDDEKGDKQNKESKENSSNKDDSRNRDANSKDRDNRRGTRDNRERDRSRRSRERGGSRFDRNDRYNERDRERASRNDKNDRGRDRDRRERRSKWEDADKTVSDMTKIPLLPVPNVPGVGSMMMPGMLVGMGMGGMGSNQQGMGGMMPGAQGMVPGQQGMAGMGSNGQNMGHNGQNMGPNGQNMGMGMMATGSQGMVSGQQMMGGMVHGHQMMGEMGHGQQGMGQGMMTPYSMQNMSNAGNMQNMGMMPGMNNMMMGNMMDQNVMMMNSQMMIPNQPVYLTDAVLLPPLPGTSMPNRREKPPGCRTIFVGGLPKGVSDVTIGEIFTTFGTISDIKVHRQGVCHVRFERHDSVEESFFVSGYRFKMHEQTENEATTLFVDYALNRDDQTEFERSQRHRQRTPPRLEQFNPNSFTAIAEKIKSDEQFYEAAPSLIVWLERGECNKKNANAFYSLIQASNNQVRRLFNEKMSLDDEYHNMKATIRDKFTRVIEQFEQVAKILAVAKHQRVSDHFTKQQRRNIEMWLKMTEEVENIKEEFNALYDDDETEKCGRNVVPAEKYEQLKVEHETLMYELEGYKNEAYLAKDEAERKFEKFKAHYIAQQALQNKGQGHQTFPPLPPPPLPNMATVSPMTSKPNPPPPTPDDNKVQITGPTVPPSEAKLISIVTAFLMVHPLGASLDYLVSYVRSMVPTVTQATVHQILQKYGDVFTRKTSGIGANIEHRWGFVTFDDIKNEAT